VVTLSSVGGVVSGVIVGVASGIGPQPASTTTRTTTTKTSGTPRVLFMTPSIAAKSRGRINVLLSGKGNSALDPG
jgi:hypothetical protein